jgi:integrase
MSKTKQPKIPKIVKLPSGRYRCQIMSSGNRSSITEDSYEECMSHALEIISKRIVGENTRFQSYNMVLRTAAERYIKNRSNVLSPSTIYGYKTIISCRFQSVMDYRIKDIRNWQNIINTESRLCSPKTLKNSWGFIKSVLKETGAEIPNVTIPQVIEKDHAFLQPEQIKKFLTLIKNKPYEMVYLLGLHGLRSSEILAIDIKKDIDNNFIRIRGAKVLGTTASGSSEYILKDTNKNASSRRNVPVMIPRLPELIKATPYDMLQRLIPDTPNTARIRLNRICHENGLPEIGLHGLRHSFASLCYHLGMSEMETMRLGGWSDASVMRRIYTHLANQDLKNAANKLKEFFK